VIWLTNDVVQSVIIGMMLWLDRSRGAAVDRFMVPDIPVDGEERGQVLLEDLEGFALNDNRGEMREWEEGMDLPLQPIVVSSKERQEKIMDEQLYAPMPTKRRLTICIVMIKWRIPTAHVAGWSGSREADCRSR
jgi:hypothetical protein